LIVSARDILT